MKLLAIVSARGDSRGVPGKNIAPVAGKPLIAWTLEAALEATCLDRIVVSSDNQEIIDISRSYGGEVPFVRPRELAGDDTPGIMPVLHSIKWLNEKEGYKPDFVVLLQPTAPLRTPEDIDSSFKLALEKNADSVVSVVLTNHHPYWTKKVSPDGKIMEFIKQDQIPQVRQELEKAYALNGAVYLAKTEFVLEKKGWYADNTYAYIMPPERSLDIDDPWDLYLADLLLKEKDVSK